MAGAGQLVTDFRWDSASLPADADVYVAGEVPKQNSTEHFFRSSLDDDSTVSAAPADGDEDSIADQGVRVGMINMRTPVDTPATTFENVMEYEESFESYPDGNALVDKNKSLSEREKITARGDVGKEGILNGPDYRVKIDPKGDHERQGEVDGLAVELEKMEPEGEMLDESSVDRLSGANAVLWPLNSRQNVDFSTDLKTNLETREAAQQQQQEELTGPRFKAVGVNPFISPAEQAFSTFSIDVDIASYTLARNYMKRGQLPPAESVRTEEFVNFFDYNYAPPTHDVFKIYTDIAPSKFGQGLHTLKIGVKGKRHGREEQRPAVLTLLIDTSGSMDTRDRLGLLQKSLEMLVEQLAPHDQIAIVQYDSHARLVLEHTKASEKTAILEALSRLQCGGSTNLEEGMQKAYSIAAANFAAGAENRVLVLSDGVANLGAISADDVLANVERYRKQGIFSSVFGFGTGNYDDVMLEALANRGDGSYAFIDSEEEARRIFVDDLAATLNTIAADVKIQVEFNPDAVQRYRQLGYENRQLTKEQFRDDSVDAGEVGSGQAVTALYEIEQGTQSPDDIIATVRVRYERTDTGKVEEIEHVVRAKDVLNDFAKADTGFRLAATVAEFSEILRGSPYAVGSEYEDVARHLRPVALELDLDPRLQELLQMVEGASGMSRAEYSE